MKIIALDKVCFSYKDYEGKTIEALKDISLTIDEGEFVAILGRNGSGKSTLAKLLNALLLPTDGVVTVMKKNTADEDNLFEIRKNVGMVFQNPDNQMVASIVEDDIAFGPENIGIEREEIIRRVDWALDAVGMREYKNAAPFKLSGGQKQRIAIAGILAVKPKVIIFDESTSMLDPKGRNEVMTVMRRLLKEGMTVVFITHDMDEAMQAERVIVLDGGRVVKDDTPANVFEDKNLEEYGLKLPNTSALAKALKAGGLNIKGGMTTTEELIDELWREICLLP
ncbi:MAG: energy-coupling factor transporter ATPase [Clostridiales bacterium]|jgi:energy-coupling factor transport system ATP-binding protein|nr:energy-coupling factor transporter ATPase [Clostridiales bacterium]